MPFSDKKEPGSGMFATGFGKGCVLSVERTHPFSKNITTFLQKGRIESIETCLPFQKLSAYFSQNMPVFLSFPSFYRGKRHKCADFSANCRRTKPYFTHILKGTEWICIPYCQKEIPRMPVDFLTHIARSPFLCIHYPLRKQGRASTSDIENGKPLKAGENYSPYQQ